MLEHTLLQRHWSKAVRDWPAAQWQSLLLEQSKQGDSWQSVTDQWQVVLLEHALLHGGKGSLP